jgi:hypothetical protein
VTPAARHRALTTAALLAAGAVLTACTGGDDAGSGAAGSTPSVSSAGGPAVAPPSTSPPGRTAGPGAPAVDPASPSVAVRSLPPARIGDPVQIARRIVVTVSNLRTATVTGSGPGEVAGDAVVLSVGVRNQTASTVDASGFSVTASYGKNRPASPSVPAAQVDSLVLQVSSNSSPDIAVFKR